MAARPFRFGVTAPSPEPGTDWAERARRVEQLGYATLVVPDHFRDHLAPVPALIAAALATTRLRVGSLVFSNDFRHPAVLAKEAATIDVLSGGRFELGLGAGWLRAEYDQAGIPFDAPATRVERLEEAVTIIKGLLAGQRVTFAGRHYTVTDLEGRPTPVQRPHPPIAANSSASQPIPTPSVTRPPESTSIVAASLASTAGWRKSLEKTSEPTRRRVVASAAAVSAGTGASCSRKWSGTARTE